VTAGTSNLIATAVALNDNTTVGVAGGTALSLSGDLSSWGLLTKVGDGPLTLTGSNTFVGGIAISQGTLALGSTNALGTGALTLSGGNLDSLLANLVNVNNNEQSWNSNFTFMGSQNLNLGIGGVTMNGNVTATVTTNTLTVGGMISSVNILTKAGNGTLVLSGANGVTFSGGVTITGGTVAVADDSALGTGTLNLSGAGVTLRSVDATARTLVNNVSPNVFDGPYILGGTGNLTFSGTIASGNGQKRFVIENTTTTFSGPLTDNGAPTGPVIKDGPGALILSADNSLLTKALTVNAGTLSLGSATAIGTGTLTLNGGNLDSLMADLVNANNNAQNWNTNFAFLGSQNLNLGAGNVTMTTNCTVTVNANTLTVGGPVNGPAFSLTKAGAGKLVLSGANTYRNTTVSAGTLEIAQATLATNSTVAVASGAVLQLGFTTTNQVAGLFLNGVSQPDGVYGSSTPGGYLAGPGYLLVHALGPSGPAHLTNNVSGSTLSLSWPAGQGWRLQAQTNALTTGLGINWSYVTDGSVSSTNVTIDASNPTVFYRLVYP
jgi:autotransporter-associated beta strand protein